MIKWIYRKWVHTRLYWWLINHPCLRVPHLQYFVLYHYATEQHISRIAAHRLFRRYGVYQFLRDCYGGIHTQGPDWIVGCVTEYIDNRR